MASNFYTFPQVISVNKILNIRSSISGKDPGRGRLGNDHDSGLDIASRKIRMDTAVNDVLKGATSVSMRDNRSHSPVWGCSLLTRLSNP